MAWLPGSSISQSPPSFSREPHTESVNLGKYYNPTFDVQFPFLKYLFILCVFVYVCICVCVITGQLVEVGSLYPPRRLWVMGWNSGCQTQQVPLIVRPSYWPSNTASTEYVLLLVCQLLLLRAISVGNLKDFLVLGRKGLGSS